MYNTILILTLIVGGNTEIEHINLGDGALSECQAIGAKWASDMMSVNQRRGGRITRDQIPHTVAHFTCSGWTDDGRNLTDGAFGDRER